VLVFYCVSGGILASVYTDLVQGSIMAVAGLLIFLTAVTLFDGGPSSAISTLWHDDPESVGPWGTLGMIGCLSWYFLFAVGSSGQPHVITKGMMIKNLRNYRFIPVIAIGGFLLTALLWVGIGIAMRALVVSGRLPALASPDDAAPVFLQTFAHPLLAGVVFAGLFAAIMSTADSFLNIGAAALTHDLPRAFGRQSGNELAWARWGTVAIAAVAALFALYSHYVNARLVALLGVFGWGTFAAALVPTVGIGLNWKRATPLAANVAIAASLIVNFTVEIFDLAMPFGVHGGSVALLVSLALFFALSYAAPPPTLPPDVAAVMDL
jgi:Na+/proline symporter